MPDRQVLAHDPELGTRYVPGLRTRVPFEGGGYLVQTNAAGFRSNHELEPAKPAGGPRVLLFGDSYTAGDGVSNEHRYGDVLERLIPGLRIDNLGVPGTGTDQQYLTYRRFAGELEHDLVVVGVFVENIRRNPARYRPWSTSEGREIVVPKPYFTREADGSLHLDNIPVPRPLDIEELPPEEAALAHDGTAGPWKRRVRRLPRPLQRIVRRALRLPLFPDYQSADAPAWLLMRAILERWAAESSVPMLVCVIPLAEHIAEAASPDGYRARFRELAAPPRLLVHDPLDDFLRLSREERARTRFPIDPHFTRRGHEVLAESLAPAVRAALAASAPAPAPRR